MNEPTTEAGRRLLGTMDVVRRAQTGAEAILAIEAEARAACAVNDERREALRQKARRMQEQTGLQGAAVLIEADVLLAALAREASDAD